MSAKTIIFATIIFLLGILAGHVQTVMSYDHVPHKWKDPKLFEMTKADLRDYLGPPSHPTKFSEGEVWVQHSGPMTYYLTAWYQYQDQVDSSAAPPGTSQVDTIFLQSRLYVSRRNEVFLDLPNYCFKISIRCADPGLALYVLWLISYPVRPAITD